MIRHLYIFCFLVLLVFSCRSSKKAAEDTPEIKRCREKAFANYERAENYYLKGDYEYSRFHFVEALADSCLNGLKVTIGSKKRFGKNEILLTDLIEQRIKQLDEVRALRLREKEIQCSRLLFHAENTFEKQEYEKSKMYYQKYQNMDCSVKDSVINLKIKILDSLINLKKN